MRAHTATHLLHHALNDLLGTTKQAWSLVEEDYLRFDFAASSPLTDQDLTAIEHSVNNRIRWAAAVNMQEMNYQEAIATWAKAFFEDKYGDVVRVVSIIQDTIQLHSVELCGGTHVNNTKDIGAFVIIAQEAVASGIRRIVAVTWPAVADHAVQQRLFFSHLSSKLDCQPKQLEEKIDKMVKTIAIVENKYDQLQQKYFSHLIKQHVATQQHNELDYIVELSAYQLADEDLKSFLQVAKQERTDKNFLLISAGWWYALVCNTTESSAKNLVEKRGIKGWGSDQLVQWKDPQILRFGTTS